jgi:hypothetical protein
MKSLVSTMRRSSILQRGPEWSAQLAGIRTFSEGSNSIGPELWRFLLRPYSRPVSPLEPRSNTVSELLKKFADAVAPAEPSSLRDATKSIGPERYMRALL